VSPSASEEQFEALLDFIRRNRGFDFTGYKRPSLARRIERRMQTVGITGYGDYLDHLAGNPDEFAALFDTILINVTSFFRDAPAWDFVAAEVLPRLLDDKTPDERIRVWSVGCATGEEAYTIAILLAEALGEDGYRERVKIYATDVDDGALGQGRRASYGSKEVAPVPEQLRSRYFERARDRYFFRADLRRSVIFGRHDLIQDPPISRIDLLVARNTLMYFSPETQAQVLASFHFALNPGGYLFLGKSEMLVTRSSLFVPVDLKRRLFRPVAKVALRDRLLHMVEGVGLEERPSAGEGRVRDSTFEASPLAQLVVDKDGALALVNLQARMLFGVSQRDLGRPFQDLDVSYRPFDLRTPIDHVHGDRQAVSLREMKWRYAGGEVRFYDIQLVPLGPDGEGPVGVSITFTDVTRHRQLHSTAEDSRKEVEKAYEELQSTAEELETMNEELQSTNEELETTNEELESTNEELETMNEELQSTNEELETLNDELRQRTDDLNRVNLFLDSILASLDAGVVVVDRELRVQAWNDRAAELWGLRAVEVQDAHFLSLDIGLPVDELTKPLHEALAKDSPSRLTVQAVNRRGRAITCDVTVRPLRTPAGESEGLILLMDGRDGSAPKGR
jgi:two-component system CheB/CheR fusion protein